MPRETSNPTGAASKSMSIYEVTSRNRTTWNRIAPEREGRPAAYFRDGGSTLEAYEREVAGQRRGDGVCMRRAEARSIRSLVTRRGGCPLTT